jgi:outer membrane protein TolC
MPNIELTISGGVVGSTALVVDPITLWNFGGSVLGPIFDAGRLRAQQSTAAARRDQAAFAYRKAALTAFSEVDNALNAERRLAEQATAVSAQRDALARALVLATNRYRAGYATYLEQLDAERSLLSADLTVVQVRSERLTTSVTLFQALGGGWSTPPIDQPRP